MTKFRKGLYMDVKYAYSSVSFLHVGTLKETVSSVRVRKNWITAIQARKTISGNQWMIMNCKLLVICIVHVLVL